MHQTIIIKYDEISPFTVNIILCYHYCSVVAVKEFCREWHDGVVPSHVPATCDREFSVKSLSTTGESRENKKLVVESSYREYMVSLARGTEVNRCDMPLVVVCNSC